ncbi:hypothetical protein FNV43_RR00070 [Rhamnella rubrinervis]|uniref:Uncharacterized protein n=1 Tax=Rhamnella rubrinervis TaxID=2594499 RepID=A0A8K0HPV8_9ROSA|nr:hypothetical protein FNV43_RR00070 [Rhamnella rubrinervis]
MVVWAKFPPDWAVQAQGGGPGWLIQTQGKMIKSIKLACQSRSKATMVRLRHVVAFQKSDGTLFAYSSPITSYGTSLQKGNLSFPVYDISALSDGKIETSKGGNTKEKATIKNVHGFLNAIS